MGLYDAGPPFEVSCDDCGGAGPAAYYDHEAEDLAEKAGWHLGVGNDDMDLCPKCVAKRAQVKP
jgi:hypothetical protein